jgi:catalase
MQTQVPKGRVAYEPSSLQADSPREDPARGFRSAAVQEDGTRERVRAETFADHYSQARLFFTSQTAFEQAHIASAFVFELSKVDTVHVREAIVGHLRHVDEDLAKRVAAGLAMSPLPKAPKAAAPVVPMKPSPALQIIGKMKATLQGRVVGILVNDGSDAAAVAKLRKAAEAAGATVKIVAPKVGGAKLADGTLLVADGQLAGTPSINFDAVAVVLSADGAAALIKEAAAIDFVRDAFGHLKAIALDDGARALFAKAGLEADAGVVKASEAEGFVKLAMTRQFAREAGVRTLA